MEECGIMKNNETVKMEYAVNVYRVDDDSFVYQDDVYQSLADAEKAVVALETSDGEYTDVVAIEYGDDENELVAYRVGSGIEELA